MYTTPQNMTTTTDAPAGALTPAQRRWLKGQAHHLKPIVTVGQAGLTEAVLAELDLALAHHELLKVRVSVGDRDLRDAVIGPLTERSGATLITRIGNCAVLFRPNPKKRSPMILPAV
jgi:RNA-binding protein